MNRFVRIFRDKRGDVMFAVVERDFTFDVMKWEASRTDATRVASYVCIEQTSDNRENAKDAAVRAARAFADVEI